MPDNCRQASLAPGTHFYVVRMDGTPLKGRQALVRVLVYPFSFILGLGLIPIVTAKSHRALHDKAAGTTAHGGGHGPAGP